MCVGGGTPVGVWRGSAQKEGKERYTERGENRGLEVAAMRRADMNYKEVQCLEARCERWNTE